MGHVEFNPTARPGSPDYGLLYTSGSDLGFSNGGGPNANNPSATQRLDSVITAILRIDPRSPRETNGVKGLGDYTIPADNKFQADGDPKTLGEIYAYGFRNAHRLSWDMTDGALFVGDIGMNHIEEVNIVHNGGNYGWMKREGYWENGMIRPGGALNQLYELPGDVLSGRNRDEFIYPVAIYDHNEGVAITGAFPYHGRIEALRGKLIFGDVNRGRLFAADLAAVKAADDGVPETVAPIEEIQLYVRGPSGQRIYTSFRELVEGTMGTSLTRTDLHLGRSRDGEIFLTSRQDGMIRMLVPGLRRAASRTRSFAETAMAENPYAAPKAHVEDVADALPDGDFLPEGRGVPAGNGWRWIADAWAFTGEQRWTFVGVFLLLVLAADRRAIRADHRPDRRQLVFAGAGRRVLARLRRGAARRAARGRPSVRGLSAARGQAADARRASRSASASLHGDRHGR